jgi:hypothetical protein
MFRAILACNIVSVHPSTWHIDDEMGDIRFRFLIRMFGLVERVDTVRATNPKSTGSF